jgi:hypothetical protein
LDAFQAVAPSLGTSWRERHAHTHARTHRRTRESTSKPRTLAHRMEYDEKKH